MEAEAAARFGSRRRTVRLGEIRGALRLFGLSFLPHGCPGYPAELQQLSHPPAGLFLAGSPGRLAAALGGPRVTIVGTRAATPYGLAASAALAKAFAQAGVTVVSGMALGIDGCAHRATLAAGGTTVAVLGSGPEEAYPRRHRALYEGIMTSGGVLSEFPPGANAAPWTFPWRNRLLAALGDAVVVVEAGRKSGALKTVECALELGRDVFVVPGQINSPTYRGCLELLEQGAQPVVTVARTVEDFFRQSRIARGWRRRAVPDGGPGGTLGQPPLGTMERLILKALEGGAAGVDRLAQATGLSFAETAAACTRLEMDGHAVRAGPGSYMLKT